MKDIHVKLKSKELSTLQCYIKFQRKTRIDICAPRLASWHAVYGFLTYCVSRCL